MKFSDTYQIATELTKIISVLYYSPERRWQRPLQCIVMSQAILKYIKNNGNYKYVESPLVNWPITARNVHQVMALDLLFDNDIKMIANNQIHLLM